MLSETHPMPYRDFVIPFHQTVFEELAKGPLTSELVQVISVHNENCALIEANGGSYADENAEIKHDSYTDPLFFTTAVPFCAAQAIGTKIVECLDFTLGSTINLLKEESPEISATLSAFVEMRPQEEKVLLAEEVYHKNGDHL